MVLFAKLLLVIFIVVLAAAVGAVVSFYGIYTLARMTGAHDINGAVAMGAGGLAPFGAAVAALLGLWLGVRWMMRIPDAAALGIGYGSTGLILLSAGAWWVYDQWSGGYPYDLSGPRPRVHIEVRLPYTVEPHWVDRLFRHSLITRMDAYGNLLWDEPRSRDEQGRTILRMRIDLYWRVSDRKLKLWRSDRDEEVVFDLGLPRAPKPTTDYGPWMAPIDGQDYAARLHIVMRDPRP